jgi:hypothetical protein
MLDEYSLPDCSTMEERVHTAKSLSGIDFKDVTMMTELAIRLNAADLLPNEK